ncbi:hypothetical protein Fmac_016896 [Flemingia macrophylla]|uniref:Uncharacterized protein n=1 Tax=Flemingia macrophylla TaxID=520843 RepID=A0ABD1MIN2_9FABA
MQKEEEEIVDSLLCPSFSAYSSDALHRVADQVTRNDNRFGQNDDDDDAFEFGKVADGVFLDAACPAFPIFDRDFAGGGLRGTGEEAIQVTLGKLLMDDSPSSCSSSSEVDDELENVPPGTYCVWKPKAAAASPCRKSKSTGSSSSRRWKLLDLLRRSNSEGKESVVFLTPSKKDGGNGKRAAASGGGSERKVPAVSAHEALYVRNREMRREVKRRSYLPYRQDLVGFCVNLNAMGKSFPLHF